MHRIRSWANNKAQANNQIPTANDGVPAAHSPSGPQAGSPQDAAAQSQPGQDGITNSTVMKSDGTDLEKNEVISPSAVDEDAAETESAAEYRASPIYKRFYVTFYRIITSSWVNVLLIFVPVGIAAHVAKLSSGVVFAMNAVAIVPLAGLLSFATEAVAAKLGDTIGALLNVTFGNAVELIIFIIALAKNEIEIVQASLLGSILANLLLILGMCFLFGGLRFREQIYNSTVTQMSACLLSISVISLLLPTAFHASFALCEEANPAVLKVSRGVSVILLLIYILYLIFQLKSHAYMYESTPQHIIDEESHPGVLADLLNSSSSSDSSDSDSSSASTSSHSSNGTAKRIRRVIRNAGRRRKSSASSKDRPVLARVPTNASGSHDGTSSHSPQTAHSADEHELNDIVSGEEADMEGDHRHGRLAKSRASIASVHSADGMTRKERKHAKKQRRRTQDVLTSESKDDLRSKQQPAPAVTFGSPELIPSRSAAANPAPSPSTPNESSTTRVRDFAGRRQFNMRTLSEVIRPAIPRAFTGSGASTQQQVASAAGLATVPSAAPTGANRPTTLRRTNSLPDRLSRTLSTTGQSPAVLQSAVYPLRRQFNVSTVSVDSDDSTLKRKSISRTSAVLLLLGTTGLVAVCAEFLVSSINDLVETTHVNRAFVGLILLPIVGNAAEHVTAVTVAAKNKMDLAIGVAVGSSIQIALFVTPLIVILGWAMSREMSLHFTIFETVSLFVSVFVVNFLVLDGRSNYLEGALLMAAYVIIGVAAFFYPSDEQQSTLGAVSSCPTGLRLFGH